MIPQVSTMISAFNQQGRCRWRVNSYAPVARSRSAVFVHPRRTNRGGCLSEQWLAPNPRARADKIAQLRQAVENGDYCVSPEQIAEKLVQEVLVAIFT
jgi:Anti-sigma-28 factor, FlgM